MRDENLWWVVMVEGIAAVLFGIAAVFWPGITLVTLLYLFAAFLVAVGLLNIGGGLFSIGKKNSSWPARLIIGLIELGVGVYLLRHPHVTFATFILLIGFTLIVRGLFDLARAFTDHLDTNTNRTFLGIAGGLGVLAGIIVLFQPAAGGVAFVWILGLYALITGCITIALSGEIHKLEQKK